MQIEEWRNRPITTSHPGTVQRPFAIGRAEVGTVGYRVLKRSPQRPNITFHMSAEGRFESALAYASEVHSGQTRKGTNIPYIAHLLAVTAISLEYGASEEEAIGALLHDAAEDAGGRARLDDIRQRFSDGVARIVEGCSDTFETPKPPWRHRKEEYIRHLSDAPPSVLLVSAADKLHNVRSIASDYRRIGEHIWARFSGGKEGTLWYYRVLADKFLELRNDPLALELNRAVFELETLARTPPT